MKYAVIQTGGKQYKVSEGDVIEVERLALEPKAQITFENVLLFVEDADFSLGKPSVVGMKVVGTILENIRGEKIRVSKFKSKVRYRRSTGHRQALSKVHIDQIGSSKEKKETVVAPKEVKKSPEIKKKTAAK